MALDPPDPAPERFRYYITDIEFQPPITDPNCQLSAKLFVDDELIYSLPWLDHTQPLRWSRLFVCNASPHSRVVLKLFKNVNDKQRSYIFPSYNISEVNEEDGQMCLDHPELVWNATIKTLTPSVVGRLFSDGADKLDHIEGVYDIHRASDTTKFLLKSAMEFAKITADSLPESTAKLSLAILMKTWEILENQTEIDTTIDEILHGLVRIRDMIDVINQTSSSMLVPAMEQSKELVSSILDLIEDATVYIFNRLATNELTSQNDAYDVEAFSVRLESLQKDFYALWLSPVQNMNLTNALYDDPSISVRVAADEQVGNFPDPYETLKLLRPMDPSGYDPDRACMDGTRGAILNRVIAWTQNGDGSERLMWISGQAGIGKTSVATSLCQRLDSIGALAGCFFCQHDNPDSRDPLRLINNLVHEIALQCPAYAHEVASAIRANRRLCNSHLSMRYEGLLKKPIQRLKSMVSPTIFVVIIDGLDECGDWTSRGKVLQKVQDMSRLVPWLKVIFTARPVGDIQEYFRIHCSHEPVVHLGDYDASEDIRAYIESELGQLARSEDWPDNSIHQLCAMSQCVFLWAALATSYIKRSISPASPRLKTVLNGLKSPVTDHFDALYTRALKAAIDENGIETREAYLQCIGAILSTSERKPLPLPDLQHLLLVAGRIDRVTLEHVIRNLRPLLLSAGGGYAKFHHSSFKGFIGDTFRSGDLAIQLEQYEAEPAICCIKFMQRNLRFNLCRLETSHLFNKEVPDLKDRVRAHIGPTLEYACVHWIDHFAVSPSQTLVDAIKEHMEGPQFMYWIESLSLLACLDIAETGLSKLASLGLVQFAGWSTIASWAKDAHRFLLSFYSTIAASTPQLYISALAFSPDTSTTLQRMRPYFPNTITVAKNSCSAWHPCVGSIYHPHPIQSLSVSPDGQKLATGHPDGSVVMWNIRTGAPIYKPLIGHSASITCIAFSFKGNLIASSSYDSSIRVWDLSGSLGTSHILSGHSGSVHAIAFSPNSPLIASGSSDKTILLWDSTTMQPIGHPYAGHSNRVSCLAFSPDGSRLASGSWDRTIRVWAVDLGGLQLARTPLIITGHSDLVTCLSFSPNSSQIVSGSADKTMRVWITQPNDTFESCKSPVKHSDSITSTAFSPDGSLIVSSSLDGSIQLFDATNLVPFDHSFGHSNQVNCLAFTPNGSYVISGSTDQTTRIWEINAPSKESGTTPTATSPISTSPICVSPFVRRSSSIYSIAISKDGACIISGSEDQTVQLWNAQTGTSIGHPYRGHSESLNHVAFSPDHSHIVSCSNDRILRYWNVASQSVVNSYRHNSIINCAVFAFSGALIALGSDDSKVHLWDPVKWNSVGNPLSRHSKYVMSVAFSPDDSCLASASWDRTISLWDTKTHNPIGELLSGHTGCVRSVAFSPCGSQLASGSDDGTVRIWNRQTGNAIRVLRGHSACVMDVSFSPDGSWVASGSHDATVRLWNPKTGQSVGEPFSGHTDKVFCIAFSPDGRYIISGSKDSTIRAWRLQVDTAHPASETTNEPTGTFPWPSNPYELIPHPHHPGWVTHDQRSLTFWLPAHYQHPDVFFSADPRTPHPQTFLDYSKFVHGTAWTGVACESIRNNSE